MKTSEQVTRLHELRIESLATENLLCLLTDLCDGYFEMRGKEPHCMFEELMELKLSDKRDEWTDFVELFNKMWDFVQHQHDTQYSIIQRWEDELNNER